MIYEVYPTIQGEGAEAGKPVILVRFSGCNLRCVFGNSLCDTLDSSFIPQKQFLDLDEVFKIIDRKKQIKNILLTGGEPTLYPDYLARFLNRIDNIRKKENRIYHVSLETNGTKFFNHPKLNFVSISPKLSSQLPLPDVEYKIKDRIFVFPKAQIDYLNRIRLNEEVLKQWIAAYPKRYQFKFVIFNGQDIEEVELIIKRVGIDRKRVWLMPAGDTLEKVSQLRPWLIEQSIKLGLNYSDRLQMFFKEKQLKI